MKRLSNHIKRAFILTAISSASVCMMPSPYCDMMPMCIASETIANDTQNAATDQLDLNLHQKSISQEMMGAFTLAEYQLKAETGDEKAQYNLANHYYYGKGIEKDYKKAIYWLTKSAEQGYEKAKEMLPKLTEKK